MIGIIGAMQIEIDNLIKLMTDINCENFSHINFFSGKINNIDCVVALCGPGKVNAAICTQIMIIKYNPKVIVNIGVAGALEKNIKIGDIVLANFVVQHDMDTSAIGDARGFISGINLIKIPCSDALNAKINRAAAQLNEKIHIGIIATGDQFISNKEKLLDIKNTFKAIVCEMEAASIGHVCFANNVKFAALKVISDNADENSNFDYEKFKIAAAEKTAHLISTAVPHF